MSERCERCRECDGLTGRAGRGEDSLYAGEWNGPYCEECWGEVPDKLQEKIDDLQSRLTAKEAECARLRHENTAYIQELGKLTVALDKLARLGNEPHFGNSIGNQIARAALRLPSPPPPQQSAPAQGENNA